MIMNLHPKLADDQEAVDAVTRQRDTITSSAADAEVLLPFAQDPDQASTAAPPDDEQDLFGREQALRMDEEIMDFQWFEHVTGDSIKELRGTTYVQPPQGSSLLHNKLNLPFHGPSFTTTPPLWPQSQLGKRLCSTAGSFWDDLQSMRLRATVRTFWMHDWNSFGLRSGQHFGPRYAPNVISLQCRMPHAEQPRNKSSHVYAKSLQKHALVKKGRALAAARNAAPVPVTEQIVQEIKSLYPPDPEPPAPAQAFVSGLFLSEVAEHIPTTLRKIPRLSEPGPLVMRAEHWRYFGSQAGNSHLFVQVISHIAAASVPNPVLQYLKAGQITPLAKPTGGHRPHLMMSFLHRLALKSVRAAKRESVAKCAEPLQYGVGRPDGANTMIKNHLIPRGSRHLPNPCCS